jgi:hypothetical protein
VRPTVALVGAPPNARYEVNGVDVGAASDNVTAATINGTSDSVWCVQLTYGSGTAATIGYSARAGMGDPGSTCTAGVLG